MLTHTIYIIQVLCKWRQLISVSLQCAVSRRELLYVHKLRVRALRLGGAQTARPIEHIWDLIADAAAGAPATGAAHGPGRCGACAPSANAQ